MKQRTKKNSVSIPRIENDLKVLLQSGEIIPDAVEDDEPPPQINLEGALEIFDRIRAVGPSSSTVGYEKRWTHPSVLALGEVDPISAILHRARKIVLDAIEQGWSGPPYNPLKLAEIRGIKLLPTPSVLDARTLSDDGRHYTIEFNPQRPPARIHYSVAHELGHTLFKDCAARIRNRSTHAEMKEDDWQLETLCNMAAAEILMPIGTLRDELSNPLSIGLVLELRQKYLVSCEAIVNRFVRLTPSPCLAFFARRDASTSQYFVEYVLKSPGLKSPARLYRGFRLPRTSKVFQCTAMGMSQREDIRWVSAGTLSWYAEYLAISPNAGELYPRVLCLAFPPSAENPQASGQLQYRRGDASEPVGAEPKLLLQLVNDRAQIWGGGFARQIRRKWPLAQSSFREWTFAPHNLQLGNVHVFDARPDLALVSVVAQHGFGKAASGPRLRYGALFSALEKVADLAITRSASVHMPRIGTGEAGGSWPIIEGIIRETLQGKNISVTIYDLAAPKDNRPTQATLGLPIDITDEMV